MFKIGVVEFDAGHDSGGATYGDQTVYRVEIAPGSLAEANAMRWQLAGQKGRVVGVTWDDDPMVDGLYRLTDCTVSPIENYLVHGRMQANVALERVPDLMETAYQLTYRTDLTPSDYKIAAVHATWADSTDTHTHIGDTGQFVMDESQDVATPGGLPLTLRVGTGTTSTSSAVQVQQGCIPSMLELGRAQIEVSAGDDAGWWILTGNKVPEGYDVRIGNGNVRFVLKANEPYGLLEQWSATGAVWVGTARMEIRINPGYVGGFVRRYVVNRNDRAQVSLSAHVVYEQNRSFRVDLTSTRGSGVIKSVHSMGVEDESRIFTVRMREYDGSDMATEVNGSRLRRTASVDGLSRPALFAETSGVTLDTSADTAQYTSRQSALFGFGRNDPSDFRTEFQVSDRLVY